MEIRWGWWILISINFIIRGWIYVKTGVCIFTEWWLICEYIKFYVQQFLKLSLGMQKNHTDTIFQKTLRDLSSVWLIYKLLSTLYQNSLLCLQEIAFIFPHVWRMCIADDEWWVIYNKIHFSQRIYEQKMHHYSIFYVLSLVSLLVMNFLVIILI